MGGKSSKDKDRDSEHSGEEAKLSKKEKKLTKKISRTFSNARISRKVKNPKKTEAETHKSSEEQPPTPTATPTPTPQQQNETPKPPPLSPEENTKMAKLDFHAQMANQEIQSRNDELKLFTAKKETCEVYEENPFKKGYCRNCKNLQVDHRDAYEDILAGLDEE